MSLEQDIIRILAEYTDTLFGGNKDRAARSLGVQPPTFWRWLNGKNIPKMESLVQPFNILKAKILLPSDVSTETNQLQDIYKRNLELEKENKYEVSGKNLKDFLDMIDSGEINEAENILLDSIDYTDRNEVMAAALFYQYLSEKDSEFLKNNNYTKEEVLSGFKQLLMKSGYRDLLYLLKYDE